MRVTLFTIYIKRSKNYKHFAHFCLFDSFDDVVEMEFSVTFIFTNKMAFLCFKLFHIIFQIKDKQKVNLEYYCTYKVQEVSPYFHDGSVKPDNK